MRVVTRQIIWKKYFRKYQLQDKQTIIKLLRIQIKFNCLSLQTTGKNGNVHQFSLLATEQSEYTNILGRRKSNQCFSYLHYNLQRNTENNCLS